MLNSVTSLLCPLQRSLLAIPYIPGISLPQPTRTLSIFIIRVLYLHYHLMVTDFNKTLIIRETSKAG